MKITYAEQQRLTEIFTIQVAYHEAAHAMVAIKNGAAYARLRMSRHDPDEDGFKPVKGSVGVEHVNAKALPMFGMAGICAEALREDFETNEQDIMDMLHHELCPSATDWKPVENFTDRKLRNVFVKTLQFLRENWNDIELIAEEAIQCFRLSGLPGSCTEQIEIVYSDSMADWMRSRAE
jgi:hypothetical protein